MNNLIRLLAAGWLTLIATGSFAQASVIVIDSFTTVDTPNPWPAQQTALGNLDVTEGPALAGVLGGTRKASILGQTFADLGLDNVQATVFASPIGLLDWKSTSGADGQLTLLYEGDTPAGLQINFQNQAGIEIGFTLYDWAGGLDMPVLVSIGAGGNWATLTRWLSSPGAQTLQFDFSDFADIDDVNLSAIEQISISFDPQAGQDFRASFVSTYFVPEPSSLALAISAATLGAWHLHRSRRHRNRRPNN